MASCFFDWHLLIDEQLTSFDENRATVVEIKHNQAESSSYWSSEIIRRGLLGSVRFFSVTCAEAVEWAKQLQPGEVSLCFIDGKHTYEDTMKNLRAFYEKTHFNSMIAGHGARNPDVMRAVREFFAEKDLPVRVFGNCWACNHCHKPKELW